MEVWSAGRRWPSAAPLLERQRVDPVAAHLVVEVLDVDACRARRLADVPLRLAQAAGDVVAFELFDDALLGGAEALEGSPLAFGQRGSEARGQVAGLDERSPGQQHGALDRVLQLADVARIVVDL